MAYLRLRSIGNVALVAGLVVLALPFAHYAIERGASFGSPEEQASSRFFAAGAPFASFAIYAHMVAGGVITALAPLQLLGAVRRRWPRLHRVTGYLVVVCAVVTGSAGLFYILTRGTIGGPVMSAGFALYGVLMLWAAAGTVVLASRRDPRHRIWAERLVILALASWLYRVHYGLWDIVAGGAGSNPEFSGPFDIVQVFAFYLPYLALHAWIRRGPLPALR